MNLSVFEYLHISNITMSPGQSFNVALQRNSSLSPPLIHILDVNASVLSVSSTSNTNAHVFDVWVHLSSFHLDAVSAIVIRDFVDTTDIKLGALVFTSVFPFGTISPTRYLNVVLV